MHTRTLKTAVAGLVVLPTYGTWLAMEWTGREPDSLIMIAALAILLGAAYHLWPHSMDSGVDAVGELQGEDSEE